MSFVKTNYPTVLGVSSDVSTQELLILTNEKRQENGLEPLTTDDRLSQAAAGKATDMFSKDYWAHNAPDGTTPWSFIKGAGYDYIYAGENLARGFNSAQDVINAWMASPEHRQNMLSANYQNVGFAVATGKLSGEDTVLVVEMLGSTSLAPEPIAKEPVKSVAVAIASPSPVANSENVPSPTQIITPTPAAQLVVSPTPFVPEASPISNPKGLVIGAVSKVTPLIDSQTFSLSSTKIVLSLFIFVLILDMILIERKKIVRFVGHNLDHVLFFSLMLLIIIILVRGSVI